MQCEHSLESYWTVPYCGIVCFTIQCGSSVFNCGSNHAVWPFFGKLLNSTVLWYCLFNYTVWFYLFHLWIKPCSVSILWKATEQYRTVALFVLLYSVVLASSTVDQTMQCDHSLESYWTVLYCGIVCFTIQCGSSVFNCGSNHAEWPFFEKLLNSTTLWCCLCRSTETAQADLQGKTCVHSANKANGRAASPSAGYDFMIAITEQSIQARNVGWSLMWIGETYIINNKWLVQRET